ncbi:MAG: hypothetical protein KAH38_02260, partial [Candidatus Hydrogenedentes bacterium]|nr:hypothetical protein [Candidatus Hydrogenedentota bacterium]
MYTEPDNNVLTRDVYVTVANTSLVSVTVANNAAATPPPAHVSLTPGQSEVTLPAGAYPLETGRFFTHTAVEASVDVDEGWGLLRWLQDGVEVSTAPTYNFQVQSNDTTITAEVASYALSLSVSPSAEWGEILATPAPVSGTPGYAPGTEVVLHAASLLPESYILHSWQVDGEEFDGSTTNFGEERTLSINRDTTVIANFKRRLRVDTVSLMGLPLNRSVPVALTGVFPTWMGTSAKKSSKASFSLTAEEAEATYEILIAGVAASFIAPATSSLLPLGTGITSLDEMDMESKNTAYIWSPEILELPADLTEVPVTIRNRTNPLNFFEILLPKEV